MPTPGSSLFPFHIYPLHERKPLVQLCGGVKVVVCRTGDDVGSVVGALSPVSARIDGTVGAIFVKSFIYIGLEFRANSLNIIMFLVLPCTVHVVPSILAPGWMSWHFQRS